MVDPKRARYIAGVDGAPPVPPPGGYQGARRVAADQPVAPVIASAEAPLEKKRANAIGWVALSVAIVFALILLVALLSGGTDVLYGVTLLTFQLIVVGVVIAALFTPRGRVLGASALAITLLLNVATVGAIGAVQTSASGSYDGQKNEEQKHEEAFPGIKSGSGDPLTQPSLEEVRAESEAALAEIRERLSEKFSYTWVEAGSENLRPERNGYGGESMLVQYTSAPWMTKEPIQDYQRKLDVMAEIEDVLVDYDMYSMYAFNEPNSNVADDIQVKLYGDTDPRKQHTWEWYTDNYPDPMLFYANIYDLSNDPSGELRAEREAETAGTDVPLEGLRIVFVAPELLSESDRAEFEERMKEYPEY